MDLKPTTDHEAVRKLALRAGLEDGTFDDMVEVYGLFDEDEIVASVALKRSADVFSVGWLAVEKDRRGHGIGRRLVSRVADDARSLGRPNLTTLTKALTDETLLAITHSCMVHHPHSSANGPHKRNMSLLLNKSANGLTMGSRKRTSLSAPAAAHLSMAPFKHSKQLACPLACSARINL